MKLDPLFENSKAALWRPPFREDFDEYKKEKGIESGYETHGAMIRSLAVKASADDKPNYILCSPKVFRKYVGRKGEFSVNSNGIELVCVVFGADIPMFAGSIDEMKLMAWIIKKYGT